MKRCSNPYRGCPELARGGAVHYCTDCYHAWQEGGYGAVQASIDAKRKPTLDKHECVGTAQITALQAEVAEYAAFKAAVLELYTFRYQDQVKQPDPDTLLERIRLDRMVAATARTAMNRDGVQLVVDTTLAARAHCTVNWLKGLQKRLGFRDAVAADLRATVQDLQSFRHRVLQSVRLALPPHRAAMLTDEQAIELVRSRLRGVRLHPTAQAQPDTGTRQLDRIESLSKQAATNGPGGWPFAAFLVGAIVAYFIK